MSALIRGLSAAKLCVAPAAHTSRHFWLVSVTAKEGFLRMFNNKDLCLSRVLLLQGFLNQLISFFHYYMLDDAIRTLCSDLTVFLLWFTN